ncbi:ABC transporter permease [Cryobacterium sp. LW097]|uniref:ABC transporter permease subunit n=1 Tax=unclassified Cryobacterium TaxID=2649013 RepID=UPI000B4C305C|nr:MULTISPECIES: ABC transporter permease subunit [unclassified Cryobacterium]ASD23322.1 ABC transporter permease [Cryobacterium sp. LW097]TFC56661.1 ABC transporter permease [Cryobacterium sp. TMB3-1-2]TFC63290.1 ABC transporter permease [Cryobacterium sp. TMB1-7]TFC72167.1 ABC transporter permease [Cryobacterium sp. TMB3-15]TFC78791.1 ABC transporter permease [Cryobacterium sp. TMB3-10]
MTTIAPAPVRAFVPSGPGLSFGGELRSEWIKLRTVRSTIWSYATVIVISLGMAALMSAALPTEGGSLPAAVQTSMLAQAATFGVFFGQLVVAVLGVLAISGEYSTGMIRSSITAVPRRLPMLAAKAVVLFVCTFVVGLISTLGSYLVAAPILAGKEITASPTDPDLLLPLLGGALYLALVAVFALGVGAMLRSSAGGISAALGILLLLPIVLSMIPAQWLADLLPYLISNAGLAIFGLNGFTSATFETWQNVLIVLGWVAVSLVGAAVLLKRRDA